MDTLTTGATVRYGWETFKKRAWFFILVTLLIGILNGVSSGVTSAFGNQGIAVGIGDIVNFLIGTLISMGTVALFLKANDATDTVRAIDLWHPQPFLRFLGARILVGLAVIIGIILLIVPGVIFGLMFMFTPYLVIDKGMSPIEAMKESKRITSGYKWKLLGLCAVLGLINVLGFICLIVGLLVSVPVTSIAIAHAYRTLSRTASAAA